MFLSLCLPNLWTKLQQGTPRQIIGYHVIVHCIIMHSLQKAKLKIHLLQWEEKRQVMMVKDLQVCIYQERRIKRLLANWLFLTGGSIALVFSIVTAPPTVAIIEVMLEIRLKALRLKLLSSPRGKSTSNCRFSNSQLDWFSLMTYQDSVLNLSKIFWEFAGYKFFM